MEMNNNNEKEMSPEESIRMAHFDPPPLLPRFRLSDELIAKIEEAKNSFEESREVIYDL